MDQDSRAHMSCLMGNAVIEYFGETAPDPVDHPKNLEKKYTGKSRSNSVRTNNENRAYDKIREVLQAKRGYNLPPTTSHSNILRIGASIASVIRPENGRPCRLTHSAVVYVLSEMKNGVADEELAELVSKFLNPQGYGTL